jgi:hypothetical protein
MSNQDVAKRMTSFLTIAMVGVFIVVLASCGGGGNQPATTASTDGPTAHALAATGKATVSGSWVGRAPAPEVINGITVPPEPAPTINNATLAGVDSNNNGVRDDVERVLAKTFGTDTSKYQLAFDFSIKEQAMISKQSSANIDAYIKIVSCTTLSAADSKVGTLSLLNTADRRKAYGTQLAGALVGDCK